MAVGDLFAPPDLWSMAQAGQGQDNTSLAAPAPITPEKHAENKGLWKTFLSKLDDPNVRQALVQTGTNLMRSPQYGQSGWDVAANALNAGTGTLQALREHDRVLALQAQERADREKQQQVQNTFEGRKISATEQNAAAYGRQVDTQQQESTANREEKKRAAEAKAEIDKYKAETERMRAKAYASGVGRAGQVSGDVQKINNLAAKYMQEDGLDEVNAKAKATELLAFGAKNEPPSKVARDLYKQRLSAYTSSIEGLKKPPSDELQKFMLEEAQRDAQKLIDFQGSGGAPSTGTPVPGTPTIQAPAQSPSSTSIAPAQAPAIHIADPAIAKKVELLKARGVTSDIIKNALIQGGVDPSLYGVQ